MPVEYGQVLGLGSGAFPTAKLVNRLISKEFSCRNRLLSNCILSVRRWLRILTALFVRLPQWAMRVLKRQVLSVQHPKQPPIYLSHWACTFRARTAHFHWAIRK